MNGPQEQYEREEDSLAEDLNSGRISQSEYNAEMRELQRDYRSACDEACWDAFDRERCNW